MKTTTRRRLVTYRQSQHLPDTRTRSIGSDPDGNTSWEVSVDGRLIGYVNQSPRGTITAEGFPALEFAVVPDAAHHIRIALP